MSTSTEVGPCTTSSDTVLLDRLGHLCTDHMCEYVNQQSTLRVTNRNQSTVTKNNSELDQAVYMPFMLQTFSQNLMKMTSRETSRSRVRFSINNILFVIHFIYLYLVDDATVLSTDPQIALRDRSMVVQSSNRPMLALTRDLSIVQHNRSIAQIRRSCTTDTLVA